MKKYLSVAFILLLALVMGVSAASLFSVTEVEAAYTGYTGGRVVPGEGLAPGTNAQFWFKYDTLVESDDEYPQQLTIGTTTYDFKLGRNTIQEYFHTGTNYVITLHPQFFGTKLPINYDDQTYAYYVMNITDIFVRDPATSADYYDCYTNGIGIIPDKYVVTDPITYAKYLICAVNGSIADVRTGTQIAPAWNGKDIYLKVPSTF